MALHSHVVIPQGALRTNDLLFFLRFALRLHPLGKLVAAVEAACFLTVLGVGAHAEPTKLVVAPVARHVLATCVFVDDVVALGALLGVGLDPQRREVGFIGLFLPRQDLFARGGTMRFFPALKAPAFAATRARHLRVRALVAVVDDLLTPWRGARLEGRRVRRRHKALHHPPPVPVKPL